MGVVVTLMAARFTTLLLISDQICRFCNKIEICNGIELGNGQAHTRGTGINTFGTVREADYSQRGRLCDSFLCLLTVGRICGPLAGDDSSNKAEDNLIAILRLTTLKKPLKS